MGYYMSEYFQNFSYLIKIYIQCTIQNSQTSEQFCCLLYIKNNDISFPKRDTKIFYDFGNDEDQEWLVEEILAHKWTNNNLELQVKWMLGDVTWEPLSSCKDLEALDVYLELRGAKAP